MNLDPIDIEKIEDYLQGNLDSKSLEDFEERMSSDTELSNRIDEIASVYVSARKSALKDKMRMLQQEEELISKAECSKDDNSKIKFLLWNRIMGIAAGIVLLGALIWLWNVPHTNKHSLHDSLFIPYPDLITERSSDNYSLIKIMNYYNSGQFETAEQLLQGIENDNAIFYKSICQIGTYNYAEAKKSLESLKGQKYPIHYYLGIINVLQDKPIKDLLSFCHCNLCTDEMKANILSYCSTSEQ